MTQVWCPPAFGTLTPEKRSCLMASTPAMLKRYEMLIDGEFVGSRKTIEVVNPSTEEIISQVPSCTVEDVNAAVLAAERAQGPWAALPAIRRAGHLREIAALIRANRESLARVITEEQGKILSLRSEERRAGQEG